MKKNWPKTITSLQNPLFKSALKLRDRKERVREKAFGVEGARELKRALHQGFQMEKLWYCPERISEEARDIVRQCQNAEDTMLLETDEKCMSRLVVRDNGDGIYAELQSRFLTLTDLLGKSEPPLILCLENTEKPGNTGAVIRSADGSGASGVLLLGDPGKADFFHPQLIRNSLGTVFSLPVVAASQNDAFDFFKSHKIKTFATCLGESSIPWHQASLTGGAAIFLGNEASGLSPDCVSACDENILLPMLGDADSLNLSAAASVLAYEARRQRMLRC